jgi:quinolinate synthase
MKDIIKEINELRKYKKAVILAHNYQLPEVQDIADYVGDSLGLSRQAANTDSEIIVFCGVHFMAETACIISPGKKVLIPDLGAGCSLADTINLEQLREWKNEHPGAVVVSYVNTSAEVKSETDYCVTSSNAVQVVKAIPEDRKILFLPDMFLGAYVAKVTGRKIQIWPGECHVHSKINSGDIQSAKEEHPDADILVHPECGCTTTYLYQKVDDENNLPKDIRFLSTDGMIRHGIDSEADEFIVATETGILHRMKKENPGKNFFPANKNAVCEYMKMITIEKVLHSLREEVYEVQVPGEIAVRAKKSIDRMLDISRV